MFRNRYFWLLISLFFVLKTEAKVTLTSIWGDNMVLQQQAEVTFRGKATPGKRVYASASWNHRKIYADCDRNGQWTLALPTPEAGGPYTITFSDGEELTLKNILIGEVWFCSGQSNMEMPVKGFRGQPVYGSQPYIVSANPKRPLRLYTVKNNWSTTPKEEGIDGQWSEASSEEVADFSATAYFFGNLLQQTYSLVDAAIVGKFLGINALASVGASTSVVFLILGFCNGCCGGFGIPVAQKFGARDYSTMRSYVSVSLKLAAGMSVVIALVTSIFCADILRIMRTPENIFEGAYAYLLVTFIGVPFTFFYNLLSSIIRALGDSKTPFWFLLFAAVLNIILDLFCILVLGWGVAGAAIATVFSQGLSAVLCYIYMYRKFEILQGTPKERRFQSKLAKTLLYIGVPMGLQFSITAIGSIMLQSANNALGTACVAAFTSAMRIKMFFICTFESLGIAMATYSGQNYGAGKPERVWLGIKASALMMIVYAAFTFVLLMVGAKYFALIFVDPSETEILLDTELFLHISCMFFPMLGLLCILRYTIQGVGYTNLAMFSGVAEMIARILVSIYAVPAFGFIAVCYGDPMAWIAADLFLVPAFIYVYRRLKKQVFTSTVTV